MRKNIDATDNSIKDSPAIKVIINAAFEEYLKSGLNAFGGEISLYGDDTGNRAFDREVAFGKGSYSLTFVQREYRWSNMTKTVALFTLMDTFNFDEYRDSGSASDQLNNIGMWMQEHNLLDPFEWTYTFEREMD